MKTVPLLLSTGFIALMTGCTLVGPPGVSADVTVGSGYYYNPGYYDSVGVYYPARYYYYDGHHYYDRDYDRGDHFFHRRPDFDLPRGGRFVPRPSGHFEGHQTPGGHEGHGGGHFAPRPSGHLEGHGGSQEHGDHEGDHGR